MKYFYFILFLLLFETKVNAQTFEWAKSTGGINYTLGKSIEVDLSGNVFITGFFNGTIDFDPGPDTLNLVSLGNSDIFISKIDPSGNLVWAKSIGGLDIDEGVSLILDDFGNIYVAGLFYGVTDFDSGEGIYKLTSLGNKDIFILKLDSSGNFIWARSMGGTDEDYCYSIAIDDSGNIYTTGSFGGRADFDSGHSKFKLISNGDKDIFISKIDSSGNFIWAKSIGGKDTDIGDLLAIDNIGNVYTTGTFHGTVDFNPGFGKFKLISKGGCDIFITKLDHSGDFVWAKSIGGKNYDNSRSIINDISGNVFIMGNYEDTVDFDPGSGIFNLTSEGEGDIFILKLDSSGNFIWVKSIGGIGDDYGALMVKDAYDDLYITGSFNGTTDFNPGMGRLYLTAFRGDDIFISKLDHLGNFIWAKSIGGKGTDYGNCIDIDMSGNVYISGDFSSEVDFDPGLGIFILTYKNFYSFILKLKQ